MAKPVKHYGKWRIRWVDASGERRSDVFDNRNDAVLVLQRHEVAAAEVRRGLRLAAPPKKTVNELCDYWLKNRTPLKRSPKDDESIIRRHIRPAFGHLLVTEVGVAHIDKFRAERVQLQKKTVNNALTTFITMLKAALELGWLLKLPAVKKPKVRLFSKDYRYLKTRDEIHRFLQAAKEEGGLAPLSWTPSEAVRRGPWRRGIATRRNSRKAPFGSCSKRGEVRATLRAVLG